VAVQTAASSGAHLTKYSNITDLVTGQKKLIVDEAMVPQAAVFDYRVTLGAPMDLTLDGGLDGIAHAWEVFMGAAGQAYYEKMRKWQGLSGPDCLRAAEGETRIPGSRCPAQPGPGNRPGRILDHDRRDQRPPSGKLLPDRCSDARAGLRDPEPLLHGSFAPKIQDQLAVFAEILKDAGYIKAKTEGKKGRALAMMVARGMIQFSKALGFPATLADAGVSKAHIKRMISAAKDPQLKMKLQNMPTPMEAERGDVDKLMKPNPGRRFHRGPGFDSEPGLIQL